MRKLTLILAALCGVILVSVLLAAVVLFSAKERILVWTLESVTGYRVVIEGPLELDLSMEPVLSVSDMRIGPDGRDRKGLTAHFGHIRTRIALSPLLSGTVLIRELFVGDTTISFIDEDGSMPEHREEKSLRDKLAHIHIPVIESFTLQNIRANYRDREFDYALDILLNSLSVDDVRNEGPLYVRGAGKVNNTDFSLNGQLGSVADVIKHDRPYPVDIGLSITDLSFRISGTIDDPLEGKGLNIHVSADEAELSNMLEVLQANVPGLGNLDLDADVTGDIEAPSVSDFKLNISGKPQTEVLAKGSIMNLLTGEGTDIAVSGLTSHKDLIHLLLPEDLHTISELELSGTLLKSEGDYLLRDVRITLREAKAVTITGVGNILIGQSLFDPENSKCDLRLNMEAENTQLIKSVLFDWLPDTGPVNGKARLIGPLIDPELKDINITAGSSDHLWINAKGRVDSIPIDPGLPVSGIDMSLSVKADEPPRLFANLGFKIPDLVDVHAEMHIHGSGDRLMLDDVAIHMTDPEEVAADVSGSAILELQENGEYLETFDLDVNITAPTISSFQRLLAARALPGLGPVSLAYKVKGTTEIFSMENVLLQAGHPGPVRIEWRGRIGNIVVGNDKLLPDVQIENRFFAEKTSQLSPYVGISIPDLGPLEGSSNIVRRKGGYGADNIHALIGDRENALVKAEGRIEYVMRGTDVAFDGIDMTVEIPGLDSRIIAEHINEKKMDIGKIRGGFSVSGSPGDITIGDAKIKSITSDGLEVSLQGGIRHIRFKNDVPIAGIEMTLTAQSPDVSAIKRLMELELPDLGAFSMSASVRDRKSEINVETLKIRTGPEDDATLLIEGSMDDIFSRDLINFALMFEAATRPWLEKLYGHKVPEDHRVKGRATFTGSKGNFHIEGTAHSGKTHVAAEVDASQVNERWGIAANISAPKVYLADVGFYPKGPEGVDPVQKDKKSRRERIFSDKPYPFPELKEMDLSFRLDTEEVIGRGFILNDFDIDVVLKDGLMLIGPSRMTYADGFVLLESSIDIRGSSPEVKLSLKAEDIDTAEVFAYLHSPIILGGHLNLSADLQSSGGSLRELASALKGELGIAIEHGKIKQIADLLGADAIDFVTTARKLGTYQELNCLALNFNFIEGIGSSQVIYIDTPGVRSVGKGTVNLREESIDLVIQPKPKKGLLGGSSPVTIKGPLSRPSVRKLPFIESARLYGEIFMPYAFLPTRAIGYVWYLMRDDKDEESPCLKPGSLSEPQGNKGPASEIPAGVTWRWQQTLYNNDTETVPSNPERYMLKLLPNGRVFIHAGCNVGRGNYKLSENHITIEISHTTAAACPEDSLQEKFIRDLNGAAVYSIEGDNLYLDLKYDTGTMKLLK